MSEKVTAVVFSTHLYLKLEIVGLFPATVKSDRLFPAVNEDKGLNECTCSNIMYGGRFTSSKPDNKLFIFYNLTREKKKKKKNIIAGVTQRELCCDYKNPKLIKIT